MKLIGYLASVLDTLLAALWGLLALGVLNTWGGVPASLPAAIVFDLCIVATFFLACGLNVFQRMTRTSAVLFEPTRAIVMPCSMIVAAAIGMQLDRQGLVKETLLGLVIFIVITEVLDRWLERRLAPAAEGAPSAVVGFAVRGGFFASMAAVVGLMLYARLWAFGFVEGDAALNELARFLMHDSFEWFLQHA